MFWQSFVIKSTTIFVSQPHVLDEDTKQTKDLDDWKFRYSEATVFADSC